MTITDSDLKTLRTYAKRLERYSRKIRESVWSPEPHTHPAALLQDIAEANEISRRLYTMLENFLKNPHS